MVFKKERYAEKRARKNAAKAPAVVFCNRCGKEVAVPESDATDEFRCADCVEPVEEAVEGAVVEDAPNGV